MKAKKRWGQHFFKDRDLLEACVEALDLQAEDWVLEIGPGRGILTELLLARAAQVTAVEIDPQLVDHLQRRFAGQPGLTLIQADFLACALVDLLPALPRAQRKVVANIPYYITTPIIMKLLHEEAFKAQGVQADQALFADIYLMIQLEVAERILAQPGSKDYGLLTVAVTYAAAAELIAVIDASAFFPRPGVDSALLRLQPRTASQVSIASYPLFWRLVRGVFQFRRKTLRNVLKYLAFPAETIQTAGQHFDLQLRGETFALEQFAGLANYLFSISSESVGLSSDSSSSGGGSL